MKDKVSAYDGDEGNITVPQGEFSQAELETQMSMERNINSPQCGYNIVDCIQDVVVGMYFMTLDDRLIDKAMFFELCVVANIRDYRNVTKRASQYYPEYFKKSGAFKNLALEKGIPGKVVASVTFPKTFSYDNGSVVVENGILISGVIQKTVIGSKKNSFIHKIVIEYGSVVASDFVWKVGVIANHWLCTHGYTFGLMDCMTTKEDEIEEAINQAQEKVKYIMSTSKSDDEKEALIIEALNNVNSIGQKLAKEGMVGGEMNAMSVATMSGAKGNFDNLMAIVACLGLQTVAGKRWKPELCEGKRTLPCFKKNDIRLVANFFVKSNYLNGLTPPEVFGISWATRDGLINTAVTTQESGYGQRRYVKKMENLKSFRDGTIRDCNGKITDFVYGEYNLDPTKIYYVDGIPFFCDILSVAKMCNSIFTQNGGDPKTPMFVMKDNHINKIIEKLYFKKPKIPTAASEATKDRVCYFIKKQIKKSKIYKEIKTVTLFIKKVIEYYNGGVACDGEMVGGLASSAMGEDGTQGALNAFHAAGRSTKTMTTGLPRVMECINLTPTENMKVTSCSFEYKDKVMQNGSEREKHLRVCELRKKFEYTCLEDISKVSLENVDDAETNEYEKLLGIHKGYSTPKWVKLYCKIMDIDMPEVDCFVIKVTVERKKMYKYRLSLHDVVDMIESEHWMSIPGPPSSDTIYVYPSWDNVWNPKKTDTSSENWEYYYARDIVIPMLSEMQITGLKGIKTIYYGGENCIDVQGNNFVELMKNPRVVFESMDTDVIHDIYKNLGIGAAYVFIYRELSKVFTKQILPCHIMLIARAMTRNGILTNVGRTGIDDDVGIITKMTNETVMDILSNGAVWGSRDGTESAASAYVLGNLGNFGTSSNTFDVISK